MSIYKYLLVQETQLQRMPWHAIQSRACLLDIRRRSMGSSFVGSTCAARTEKAEKFSPDDPVKVNIYIEISPSGHAPNHETPVTVNAAIEAWIKGLTREQSTQPALTRQLIEKACNRQYMEKSGVQTRLTMKDGESSNLFESIVLFADSLKEMWSE